MFFLRDFRIMKLSSESQKVALRKIMTNISIFQSRSISEVTNTSIDKGEFSIEWVLFESTLLIVLKSRMYQWTYHSQLYNILGSSQEYDPYQESLMAEECILVDADDKAIGKASKRVCHTIDSSTGTSPLHRAFSLFIFNCDNKLLLQQR